MQTHKYMIDDARGGIVFPYMEEVAKNKGFRPYNGKLPKIDPERGLRFLDGDSEFEEDEQEVREAKEADAAKHRERIDAILDAFSKMEKIEFATSTGAPKLASIAKILKYEVTKTERDEAFTEWQKRDAANGGDNSEI